MSGGSSAEEMRPERPDPAEYEAAEEPAAAGVAQAGPAEVTYQAQIIDILAAGIVAVAALSFLAYSYTLIRTIHTTSQSLPAVASALLAGMCIGFLVLYNFYPARIFMGDIGAMLLGLLLAYGPISSTDSLDPALLTNYGQSPTLDRFPTLLPLLVPAAIFIIPYADLMFAVIRRTRAWKPIMAADRQHLHHRLLNIGHSYRQSVLIMYLWAALWRSWSARSRRRAGRSCSPGSRPRCRTVAGSCPTPPSCRASTGCPPWWPPGSAPGCCAPGTGSGSTVAPGWLPSWSAPAAPAGAPTDEAASV